MSLSNMGFVYGFNAQRPEEYLKHTDTSEQFAMATGMLRDTYVHEVAKTDCFLQIRK